MHASSVSLWMGWSARARYLATRTIPSLTTACYVQEITTSPEALPDIDTIHVLPVFETCAGAALFVVLPHAGGRAPQAAEPRQSHDRGGLEEKVSAPLLQRPLPARHLRCAPHSTRAAHSRRSRRGTGGVVLVDTVEFRIISCSPPEGIVTDETFISAMGAPLRSGACGHSFAPFAAPALCDDARPRTDELARQQMEQDEAFARRLQESEGAIDGGLPPPFMHGFHRECRAARVWWKEGLSDAASWAGMHIGPAPMQRSPVELQHQLRVRASVSARYHVRTGVTQRGPTGNPAHSPRTRPAPHRGPAAA
jgi:hypothetical protein